MSNSDDNADRKKFGGYLIANWRDGDLRYRKTSPDGLAPNELALPVDLTVVVPEVETPALEATVEVPQPAVEGAVRDEQAEAGDVDVRKLATEVVQENEDNEVSAYFEADEYELRSAYVDALMRRALDNTEGTPDHGEVRNAIQGELNAYEEGNDV